MGHIREHSSVLLILAAFSRHRTALEWTRQTCQREWGPVELSGGPFEFNDTDYYGPSMGADLLKELFAFQRPIDPASLVSIKQQTNRWEETFREQHPTAESRPLNLDPGYLTEAKLVLASTKDHAHRIYLSDGIYAEITLFFRDGRWQPHPWTFPDYRRADYHNFFTECRGYLRDHVYGKSR